MQTPREMLVVMDKPKHTQDALDRALALARLTGARLHLTSFCWLAMAEHDEVFDTHQRRQLKDAVIHERQQWLRDLLRDRGLEGANLTTEVVWTQDIAGWVHDHEQQHNPDLIVKTVHRNARTLIHTPLDWKLLRGCRTPLWMVASGTQLDSGQVLATIDLRHKDDEHLALNNRVLETARGVAEMLGGEWHCGHAVEASTAPRLLDERTRVQLEERLHAHSAERLAEVLAPYAVDAAHTHIVQGKVGHAIGSLSQRLGAAVLVVGTSSRRRPGNLLLGVSAEKILAHASCDVLAVHNRAVDG